MTSNRINRNLFTFCSIVLPIRRIPLVSKSSCYDQEIAEMQVVDVYPSLDATMMDCDEVCQKLDWHVVSSI
jgi:hypothetical protein